MRSLSWYGGLSLDSIRAGTADARKAVAIAPDYAIGHASLAQSLAREAQTHAQRALTLDGSEATVLTNVGHVSASGSP
jgi:Tfp pilus assembly protein PilF